VEERRVVTVLFCDLAGFTARSDQADPEDVRALLRPYHARLRAEIERFGGTLLGLGRCATRLGRPSGRDHLLQAHAIFGRLGARPADPVRTTVRIGSCSA
jgi:class 3 adenylate cyclase